MHEDSSIVVWDAEDTVYRKRQRLTLEEKSFRYSDSDHPIMIQGSMTDNAGHVSEEVLEQGIIIDTEKPVIKVEYDRNNQTEYYNTERYQWDLARLSPVEYYQYLTTGIYPLIIPKAKGKNNQSEASL